MPTSSREAAELQYVRDLFYKTLDSIRYAKDKFNPHYARLETRVKLQTTAGLRAISNLAGEYFYKARCKKPGNYDPEELKAESIEYALDTIAKAQAAAKQTPK